METLRVPSQNGAGEMTETEQEEQQVRLQIVVAQGCHACEESRALSM